MHGWLCLRHVFIRVDIKNNRDLAKIIVLCRKNGVETCKITPNSIEFTLTDVITRVKRRSKSVELEAPTPVKIENELTAEEKLFWSSPNINENEVAS